MKHLTDEQLSRRVDGALEGRALAEVESHLASCPACRAALAVLAATDAALRPALAHDPGPEYFETFAARVEDRIRAAGLSGAQARERPASWLGSPRRLAWVGGVAALVVGAALALIQSQNFRTPDMRSRDLSSRIEEAAPAPPPAPQPTASGVKEGEADGTRANEPRTLAREKSSNAMLQKQSADVEVGRAVEDRSASSRGAAVPGRAQQVRRDARGEDVPVEPSHQTFAQPPAAEEAPPAPSSVGGIRAGRAAPVQPMSDKLGAADERQEAARLRTAAPLAAGETPLCGEVVDQAGRPVANAQVVLAKRGHTASTDANGRFCLGAPAGDHEMAVMAVGFRETRQQVHVGGESAEVRLIVNPVDVLEPGLAAKAPSTFTLDASTERLATEAQRLRTLAAKVNTADAHDAAAEAWERVLRGPSRGPHADAEARYQLGEARYRAWRLAPSEPRRKAAIDALGEFLRVAPTGTWKLDARRWLKQVQR